MSQVKISTKTPSVPTRPTAPKPAPKTETKKPAPLTVPKPQTLPTPTKSLAPKSPKTPSTPRFVLPEHWEQKLDPKSNRYYYIDHRTKTTSWNPPDTTVSTPRIDRTAKPAAPRLAEPNWELLSPAHGHGYHGKTGLKGTLGINFTSFLISENNRYTNCSNQN